MAWFSLLWNYSSLGMLQQLTKIVPERARTSIYALDRSFESILPLFAPPVFGILAQQVYSYKPLPKGPVDSKGIETDRKNAASLGKALYTAIGIPMAIWCSFYSFLYFTYPRDKDRARMDALIESELHHIETENSGLVEEYTQRHASDSHGKQRSVVDIDIEGEESLDFDENDEQRLLSHEPDKGEIVVANLPIQTGSVIFMDL